MKKDWIQISTNIAVVIGLIVLIYEVNQNYVHARSQVLNDDYINIETHLYTLMGENPAEAIAKARSAPEQLTEEERIVVDAHLLAQYFQLEAYEYIAQTGVYEEGLVKDVVPVMYTRFFNYPYAKTWWIRERCIDKAWITELKTDIDASMGTVDAQCESAF